MVKKLSKHAELLNLLEISGPFLAVSVLDKVFPQGMEKVETPRRQKLRAAYEEWREAVDQEDGLLPELHREWIRLVLTELLEFDHESLVSAADWTGEIPSVSSQERSGLFQPDWIVRSPADHKPRLFVAVLPPDTDLESVQRSDGWPTSPQERMTLLCRAHGVRLGLLTNGERWMLVNAPVGSISSQVSWYGRLWFQEPITLKAFLSLLGVRRCFGPVEDTLESLLDESLEHHEEVTDTLGEQVRRAVEVLVQCLDKADEDRNRELLRDVKPAELYEAALTVMMRLVFVLCAEERGLLLLGDPVYDQGYAVSTLRGQLTEDSERHGPEVLDRRHDAWARLLAVFRAVYGGIEHESLRLPALGGSLFDPDRFPFLEGRAKGTCWRETSAAPLPIDNRTVLLLLNSLQLLEQSGGALLLSYRALDVEQIGHVYEGLLEHTVARVPRVTLGLQGSQKAKNPNVALAELESARLDGEAALVKLIQDVTGRSESAIGNGLSKPTDETVFDRVSGVCGGDTRLAERIKPFTNLLRTDAWADPIVYRDNSFMVTLGADRRETGTHYTPKSLTESIVTTTLEPVVYVGPAEGKPREEWVLKSSREILNLKVCDPAMGSGAFLVQACRYLGEKLVEAWLHEEVAGKVITIDGDALDRLGAEDPLPSQLDERLIVAHCLVAERCLYGVDINPLAVELAKLSIWLVTLAKGRPFGFLGHNLRCGDSLLGIHRLDQLTRLQIVVEAERQCPPRIFGQNVEATVNEAVELRKRLRAITIRDIKDVEIMALLDCKARQKLEPVELIADAIVGEALRCGGNTRALDNALDALATVAGDFLNGVEKMEKQIVRQVNEMLAIDLPVGELPKKSFHWALEFPEVFSDGGFSAVIGNPPFYAGAWLASRFGANYRAFIVAFIADGATGIRGTADLCSYFLLRAHRLVSKGGFFGMILNSTVVEGDSKAVGMDRVVADGSQIINATGKKKWPGSASVDYVEITMAKSLFIGEKILNGERVDNISTSLLDEKQKQDPVKLSMNSHLICKGHELQGDGFKLTDAERLAMVAVDPKNADVLSPLIIGDDLNNMPVIRKAKWVINFRTMDLKAAEKYEIPIGIVKERVKPERDGYTGHTSRDKFLRTFWWQFRGFRKEIDTYSRNHAQMLACTVHTKFPVFTFIDSDFVPTPSIFVFLTDQYGFFGVMQSSIHTLWALAHGSSLGETPRYVAGRCFNTFPLPDDRQIMALNQIGRKYFNLRAESMLKHDMGLTAIYNEFHNPKENSPFVGELRKCHTELDREIVRVYKWDDLELKHDFFQLGQEVRFMVSDASRKAILGRLLDLNHRIHAKEKGNIRCNRQSATAADTVDPRVQDGLFSLPTSATAKREMGGDDMNLMKRAKHGKQ